MSPKPPKPKPPKPKPGLSHCRDNAGNTIVSGHDYEIFLAVQALMGFNYTVRLTSYWGLTGVSWCADTHMATPSLLALQPEGYLYYDAANASRCDMGMDVNQITVRDVPISRPTFRTGKEAGQRESSFPDCLCACSNTAFDLHHVGYNILTRVTAVKPDL